MKCFRVGDFMNLGPKEMHPEFSLPLVSQEKLDRNVVST